MNINVVDMLRLRRIAAVSPQTTVGNVPANVSEILSWATKSEEEGADIILFPEMSITGYSVADIVRWPDLLSAARNGLETITQWTLEHRPLVVVGLPINIGAEIYNCAAVVGNGIVYGVVPKTFLPQTREFYETRWFTSGSVNRHSSITLNGSQVPFGTDLLFVDADDADVVVGIELCEDLWAVQPPSGVLAQAGATVLLNLSASNELVGKSAYRTALIATQAARCYAAYAYASAGPTESTSDTVYSGHCVINECGDSIAESSVLSLKGAWAVADVDVERIVSERRNATTFKQHTNLPSVRNITFTHSKREKHVVNRPLSRYPFVPHTAQDREIRFTEILNIQATALAVRMQTIGAKRLVVGVSGGLDSAWALLVCHEACSLLGLDSKTVLGVSMPGFGTTERTRNNAHTLTQVLSSWFMEIDIRDAVTQHFADINHSADLHDVVFENAQARERTQVLMDLANKVGGIVVGTGDLSEMALGWCTYNGDHMSMYAVNSGVPKTLIQHLVEWYATSRAGVDLQRTLSDVLSTPISPELMPIDATGEMQQHTEETIGPYELHDFFLYHLIRYERSVRTTAALAIHTFQGSYTAHQILRWLGVFITRFFASQFKRNCQPDGIKVGSVALSPRADWRLPSEAQAFIWMEEVRLLGCIFTE